MLETQLLEAISAAANGAALDNLARITWRGVAEGLVSDTHAEALSIAIEARRSAFRAFETIHGVELPSLAHGLADRQTGQDPSPAVEAWPLPELCQDRLRSTSPPQNALCSPSSPESASGADLANGLWIASLPLLACRGQRFAMLSGLRSLSA